METCLLCLRHLIESENYIEAQSTTWIQLEIQNIIEKHLWSIVNFEAIYGICEDCWSHLYQFHQFYRTVEEAHLNKVQLVRPGSLDLSATQLTPIILKVESLSNETTGTSIVDGIKSENQLEEIPGEIKTVEAPVPKKPRGRPRKIIAKAKVGRPPKIPKDTSDLPLTNVVSSSEIDAMELLTISNKKPKGKVGRPRKYFKEINELPPTNNCQPVKPKKRGRPFKKKWRGRPHNLQVKETINPHISSDKEDIALEENESALNPLPPMVPMVQLNIDLKHSEGTKELNLKDMLKKQKKKRQHKAKMRNYIATSVRCMNFFKNKT